MTKIDIISGFLGAGKTTFANMLLRHYMESGLRPVYIVNEIGESGIDAEVMKADGFHAVEVEGGCICCTLKGDIANAMAKVMDTFSPTNIVFEPSGIFIFDNFIDILRNFENRCVLGNVFTIVDSINFPFSKAAYGSFIYNQIKNAAVIILSKLERAKNYAKNHEEINQGIDGINKINGKINGKINEIDEILCDIKNINPNVFIMSKIWAEWDKEDFEILLSQEKPLHMNHHAHHHNDFKSLTVKLTKPFTEEEIDNFISSCTAGAFGDLCRVKGVIMLQQQPMLLNIAMQDTVMKKFSAVSNFAITFIGQAVDEEKILCIQHIETQS